MKNRYLHTYFADTPGRAVRGQRGNCAEVRRSQHRRTLLFYKTKALLLLIQESHIIRKFSTSSREKQDGDRRTKRSSAAMWCEDQFQVELVLRNRKRLSATRPKHLDNRHVHLKRRLSLFLFLKSKFYAGGPTHAGRISRATCNR